METTKQIQIWFFIGALLLMYGVLIFGVGIYHIVSPPVQQRALSDLHADLWWGALLVILGSIYCVKYRPSKS
jgi:energy-converting hydrogenase Eha subunit E